MLVKTQVQVGLEWLSLDLEFPQGRQESHELQLMEMITSWSQTNFCK